MFLRNRSVAGNARVLNMVSFWFNMRFNTVTAVLYFASVTGSYVGAVSIVVICRVAQGLFEIPTGIVSDRLGRVWCLRLGVLAGIVNVGLYLVGGSFWWLAVGAVFDGMWQALFSGNNEALLYESTRESGEDFGHHVARMNVMMEIAGFIAVIAGGAMAVFGYWQALVLTMLVQTLALVLSFGLVEPVRHIAPERVSVFGHVREAISYLRSNGVVRNLSLAGVINEGFSTWALWPAFYATQVPVWAVGMLISANYLQSAIGFRLAGRMLARWRAAAVALWGTVFARVVMLPGLLFPSPLSPVFMALGGSPYGPITVAERTMLHAEFTDHQRATLASVASVATNAVYGVFAMAIGVVADRFGAGTAILVGQLCLMPTIWLYWRVARKRP